MSAAECINLCRLWQTTTVGLYVSSPCDGQFEICQTVRISACTTQVRWKTATGRTSWTVCCTTSYATFHEGCNNTRPFTGSFLVLPASSEQIVQVCWLRDHAQPGISASKDIWLCGVATNWLVKLVLCMAARRVESWLHNLSPELAAGRHQWPSCIQRVCWWCYTKRCNLQLFVLRSSAPMWVLVPATWDSPAAFPPVLNAACRSIARRLAVLPSAYSGV